MDVSSWVDPHKGKRPNKTLCRLGQNTILQSYASLLGFPMPKRRDGIMTVRIPLDEKEMLQKIAEKLGIRDFHTRLIFKGKIAVTAK